MLFPSSSFASAAPTPAKVKAATLNALSDAKHFNPAQTYEALRSARPQELRNLVACHHGKDDFAKKLKVLCSTTLINATADTAQIVISTYAAEYPGWQNAKMEPKKTVRARIDLVDKASGAKTDVNMTRVRTSDECVSVGPRTHGAEKNSS